MSSRAPVGYRDPAHEELYRTAGIDPRVQKDYFSPSIEGYFHLPAVWVGARPQPEPTRFDARIHHEVVLSRKLSCGIETRVFRDGHFLFDFESWPTAPQILIPGYTKPQPDGGCEVPAATTLAEEKAEG